MLISKERETIIWLARLISTDGWIQWSYKQTGCISFGISSVEKEWLKLIQRRLEEIGLNSNIGKNKLYLHNPRKLLVLFTKYNCGSYFNPRKWQRVASSEEIYQRKKHFIRFSSEEDQIVLSDEPIKSILKKLPSRTYAVIWDRRKRLKHVSGN